MSRIPRSLVLAALLSAGAVHAQFCPGVTPWVFSDVPAGDPFCGYITWIAQKGVTLGCRELDPLHREYCPDDFVTREQMAAFLRRLDTAEFPTTCAIGQVLKWTGTQWTCGDDVAGGAGGTVTSLAAGTGITAVPNPITTTGSINVATTYQLPQGCAANQVPKWVGGVWTCANDVDSNSGGTVTAVTAGTGLTGGTINTSGTIAVDPGYVQRRVSGTCAVGSSIRAIAADGTVTCETDDAGPANAFVQGGNDFRGTAILGTLDEAPLVVVAGNRRVMRYEPNAVSPNVVGGHPENTVSTGVRGATIAGGGVGLGDTDPLFPEEAPNRATDHYTTIGGGYGNMAGNVLGTLDDRAFATVAGGGWNTADGQASFVGGGIQNRASGNSSTVGSGRSNVASGGASVIAGGASNSASGVGSVVVGGAANEATGYFAFATGLNCDARGDFSIAMGHRAKTSSGAALGHGAIVLADSSPHDFNVGVDNRFAVRATGGVQFVLGIDATGAATWTCQATSGSGWSCASDRNLKHSVVALDGRDVLDRLASLPLYQWQPKGQDAHVKHFGPMAQDFHAAFGLGDDETMIGLQDADGVALAAIQGLHALVKERDATIARQEELLRAVQSELDELRAAVHHLLGRSVPR